MKAFLVGMISARPGFLLGKPGKLKIVSKN